ncbi:hypothetical protein [Sulfuriflexus mobilis]|uniref:hypothetical protein n=1 Tax=Sulfuriflexus mobilis TaxID=1811807 RepID=UPI000F81EB32|nr:hypothetical protein [Sulfuriflexus mobilis]
MALKEISLTLGILAGSAGVTNGGYTLYKNFVTVPAENAEYNQALMTQTPLLVESIEIQPVAEIAMRVEVTVKIFKTGDILVESGSTRQFIPFSLGKQHAALGGLIGTAHAGEVTLIDGVSYEMTVLKYTEATSMVSKDRMQRIRVFADGQVETSIINIRSSEVVETQTQSRTLSDEERSRIEASPYKKKIFTPVIK